MDRSVTVVIACFNEEPEYLQCAVRSAIAQEVPAPFEVEVIVVDDGSTRPDTLACLGSLDSEVRVMRTPNAGPAAARNAGTRAGTGGFVVSLDSDDYMSTNFVFECWTLLGDPQLKFAYTDLGVTRSDSVEALTLRPRITLAELFQDNQVPPSSMFRRDDWERLGGWDESLIFGFEDYEWWVRLLRSGGFASKAPGATLYRRIKPGSRTLTVNRDAASALASTRERILANNQGHLEALIRAGWAHVDEDQETIRRLRTELAWWSSHFGRLRSALDWPVRAVRRLRRN